MSHIPKLSLVMDVEKDIENAVGFLVDEKDSQFLGWFFRGDAKFILNKAFSKKEQKKIVREYTMNFYTEHEKEIQKGLTTAKRDWKKIEKRYFALVEKLFQGHAWPKGEYIGATSIFRLYPRYLDEKLFFFPYTHQIPKLSNGVIAHEMLHFIFFDYIFAKYGLKEGSKVKGNPVDYVWQVSEVFNAMMERWEPYRKIVGIEGRPYPGHEKMYATMRRQWTKNQDIDWLLDQWLK